MARLVEQPRQLVRRGRRISVGPERRDGVVGRHRVRAEQLGPGALLGAELAQAQLAPVLQPHQDARGAIAERRARVEELKAARGHEVHEQGQVAGLHREHLADAAHAVELPAGERVERRIERLQRYQPGRERRLHERAHQPRRQAACADLDLGQLGHGPKTRLRGVRISIAADERTGVAEAVVEELRRRGHEPIVHGALSDEGRDDWAWASGAAARDVADGRAEQGVVCCWTGTGASIAANKVPGVRAALCGDAATADGARRWNDANVLALSLRTTSEAELGEILDAWFGAGPSDEAGDAANVAHLGEIEG